jgi:hypothetical protein
VTAGAPIDAALPQIATLWNAEAMLEVFRNELSEIDGAHPSIHACRILRVRYRPGTRSIVLYELDTAGTTTGGDPLWVTAVTYADDRAASQHTRLSRSVADASTHGLRPYAHVGSLRSLLQIYPYDRELPALPSLAAGTDDGVCDAIASSLDPGLEPGGEAGDEWRIVTARYRPMQGATLRYTSCSDPDREVFVKAYRGEEGAHAMSTLEALRSATGGNGSGPSNFGIVRPLAYCTGPRTLVVERAPGRPMPDLLTDPAAAERVARLAARSLHAFHASDLPCESPWGPAEMLDRVGQAGALITVACPELTEPVNRIAAALADYPTGYESRPSQLDPKPDHFFFEDDRVTFIDLDTFASADPAFDAAFMYARTAALTETAGVPAELARAAAEAFLEEYFSVAPPGPAGRFAINHAYALLQLTLYAVRHQAGGWRELAAARIGAALEACALAESQPECPSQRI